MKTLVMREYRKCQICKEFHYTDQDCLPIYGVNLLDYHGEEEFQDFHANSEEDAAEKFAEYYNSNGDYCLMNETEIVSVKNPDGEIKKFEISAEPSVYYSACEIE